MVIAVSLILFSLQVSAQSRPLAIYVANQQLTFDGDGAGSFKTKLEKYNYGFDTIAFYSGEKAKVLVQMYFIKNKYAISAAELKAEKFVINKGELFQVVSGGQPGDQMVEIIRFNAPDDPTGLTSLDCRVYHDDGGFWNPFKLPGPQPSFDACFTAMNMKRL